MDWSRHDQAADLLLFNGKIVTVDDAFSIREAIAIKDGRILYDRSQQG
jgi:predicted amidohydrolase YtcJ